MIHDTKVAINLRDDLPVWKQLNVISVTISEIVETIEAIIISILLINVINSA